jgi:hypothetical protein
MDKIMAIAENNFLALKNNPYPGRGIIVGADADGKNLVLGYWIMGRSPNSRNRIFVLGSEEGSLKTAPVDPSKIEDSSLIFYQAMAQKRSLGLYVVSNGSQTSDALDWGPENLPPTWHYEPDEPNFTPRITAGINLMEGENAVALMSILKKSPFNEACDRYVYRLALAPGLGYCITTYSGDGNPLPPFQGDPYLVPLAGNIKEMAQTIWSALNEDNRVSLALKFINTETNKVTMEIINKYGAI